MLPKTEENLAKQINRIKPLIHALAKQSSQVTIDGDDLLQQVCLAGLEGHCNWSELNDGWFIVTAQNILKSAGRREKCWNKYLAYCANQPTRLGSTPSEQLEAHEISNDVRCQVQSLPPSERIVVEKRFFNCPIGNVNPNSTPRTQYWRAKQLLRTNFRLKRLYRDLRR